LKNFLYERVYGGDHPGIVELRSAGEMIKWMFWQYMANPRELPTEVVGDLNDKTALAVAVCDFIAGMTDRYAVREYNRLKQAL